MTTTAGALFHKRDEIMGLPQFKSCDPEDFVDVHFWRFAIIHSRALEDISGSVLFNEVHGPPIDNRNVEVQWLADHCVQTGFVQFFGNGGVIGK